MCISDDPLRDTARGFLKAGVPPNVVLIARHDFGLWDVVTTTLGAAAQGVSIPGRQYPELPRRGAAVAKARRQLHFPGEPAMSAALQAAQAYVARGWNPLPLPFKSKIPTDTGWQKRVIGEPDLPRYFNGKPQNVGVVLGPTSSGLTDVDLDCREAIELAPHVLPKTGAIFGRQFGPGIPLALLHASSRPHQRTKRRPFRSRTRRGRPTKQCCWRCALAARKARRPYSPARSTRATRKFAGTRSGDPAKVANDDLLKRARLLASIMPVRPLLARQMARAMTQHCLSEGSWPAPG